MEKIYYSRKDVPYFLKDDFQCEIIGNKVKYLQIQDDETINENKRIKEIKDTLTDNNIHYITIPQDMIVKIYMLLFCGIVDSNIDNFVYLIYYVLYHNINTLCSTYSYEKEDIDIIKKIDNNAELLNILGHICQVNKMYDESIYWYTKAIEKKHIKSMIELAKIFRHHKRPESLIINKLYLTAIAQNSIKSIIKYANYLRKSSNEDCFMYYKMALKNIKDNKNIPEIQRNIGLSYMTLDMEDEAKEYFELAIKNNDILAIPHIVNIYYNNPNIEEELKIVNYLILFMDKIENLKPRIYKKHSQFIGESKVFLRKIYRTYKDSDSQIIKNIEGNNKIMDSIIKEEHTFINE